MNVMENERFDPIECVLSLKKSYTGNMEFIDLSVGSPDTSPPAWVIETMKNSLKFKKYHGYPPKFGAKELIESVIRWYKERFNVKIPSENHVVITSGVKEAIFDTMSSILNECDTVLLPDPGYPTYSGVLKFTKSRKITYNPEKSDDEILEYLEQVMKDTKPSVLILNYPNNPTGRILNFDSFSKILNMAKMRKMKIFSDLAYSEIFFDREPHSAFEIIDDFKNTVEFLSFSKTYSMAGWRIGVIVGDEKLIDAVKYYRSFKHSGVFYPIQLSAVSALEDTPLEYYEDLRERYRRRRDILCGELEKLGFSYLIPQGAIYVWAEIPSKYSDLSSFEFVKLACEKAGILLFPGDIFGENGKGKVRFSLVVDEEKLMEVGKRMKKI